MDLALSGMFRHENGSQYIASVDNLILTGRRNENIQNLVEHFCEIYRKEMQFPIKEQTVKLSEIISMLPKNYKTYQTYDRYVLIMDVTRKVYHTHFIKQVVKKEKISYADSDQKNFALRSRNKINKANTVISETTDVKSQFTRL